MITYQPYLSKLELRMQQFIKNAESQPQFIYNMIQYHMGWLDDKFNTVKGYGGKRLRPLFLMLTCEALCNRWDYAIPAAVAVELLHNFTLIHDDIEDRDDLRHGRPTIWKLWGIPQAINAGDALYALAYKILLTLSPDLVDYSQILKIVQVYTDAILHITEGQCLDIGFETHPNVLEDSYISMISGKTAVLFGLCCELGAIIARADNEKQRILREFGTSLGMAFQIQDDILGLWGDPKNTGKPVGSDLVKGKKTLPIIHCARQNAEFKHLIANPIQGQDIDKAMQLLDMTESLSYSQEKARHYLATALHALDSALPGAQKNQLQTLVNNLVQRQS